MKLIKKFNIKGSDKTVYMIRWTLLSLPFISVKVHKFLRSDMDCMHDHPWSFISIIVKGSYLEETDKGFFKKNAGDILFRSATHKHRIWINKPCWSFVITFKKKREWGFWTKEGWVKWTEYFRKGWRGGTCN